MDAPSRYVAWINEHLGFNPRSQTHSNALSNYLDEDLRRNIPGLKRRLDSGDLIFKLGLDVPPEKGPRSRNIDMGYRSAISRAEVLLAVENKTTMTAHGRARKNRLGDLLAYTMHLHTHHPEAVAGFTIVVNAAERYRNPDEFSKVAKHQAVLRPSELEGTIRLFREVPLRIRATDPSDIPEALAIVVVEYDGRSPAKLFSRHPAPQPGDTNHYDVFIRTLSQRFDDRFGHT